MSNRLQTTLFILLVSLPFLTLTDAVAQKLNPADAAAQSRTGMTELGVIVGEPTGLSAKFWTGDLNAFDLGLAWSFSGRGSMHMHSTYLFHTPLQSEGLIGYYGAGLRLLMQADPSFGLRIPGGLEYLIPESPLAIFFELAPMLDLAPDTRFDVNGGLGVRYVF